MRTLETRYRSLVHALNVKMDRDQMTGDLAVLLGDIASNAMCVLDAHPDIDSGSVRALKDNLEKIRSV